MKKLKTPKRFRSSRVLLSLATCSIVLVLVGITVYATALPGVFTDEDGDSPFGRILFGDINLAGDDGSNQADAAELQNGASAGTSLQAGSLTTTPSMSAFSAAAITPVLEKVSSQVTETSTAIENGTIQDMTPTQQGSSTDQDSSQPQMGAAQAATQSSHFSEEAEAAFHAHLVKYYNMMMADYEYLAEIYNYLYSSLEAGETYVNPYPIDVETYISQLDKRRAASYECMYNGEKISSESKWFRTYDKLILTYHDLVNATSILRDINGGYATNLRERLKYYSDLDCDPMRDFRENSAQIKL